MPTDPIIDEIYAIKKAIAEECGYDADRLFDHLAAVGSLHPGPKAQIEPVRPIAPKSEPRSFESGSQTSSNE